jgi:DUF4097 and DUF4098 domain-containing protein YvlB
MKRTTVIFTILCIFFTSVNIFAQRKKELDKTFDSKDLIEIDLVLGDCNLKQSEDGKVHVYLVYTYDDDYFEPRIKERSNALIIEEKFYGRNGDGDSEWTISVPKDCEIDFEAATGSLYIDNLQAKIDGNSGTGEMDVRESKGKFDLNSGTGRIVVEDSDGSFELNSGTGRVKVENCSGDFDVNSGTGKTVGINITIQDEAEFNSGTGTAEVTRPKGEDFELFINSGTGNAVLDMDGEPIEGYFEFSVDSHGGDIRSPIEFDDEEEYREREGYSYRRYFTKGKKTPRYYISTGTGTAELKR